MDQYMQQHEELKDLDGYPRSENEFEATEETARKVDKEILYPKEDMGHSNPSKKTKEDNDHSKQPKKTKEDMGHINPSEKAKPIITVGKEEEEMEQDDTLPIDQAKAPEEDEPMTE